MKRLNKITILIWLPLTSLKFIGPSVSFILSDKDRWQLLLRSGLCHTCTYLKIIYHQTTFHFDWRYTSFALMIIWILMDLLKKVFIFKRIIIVKENQYWSLWFHWICSLWTNLRMPWFCANIVFIHVTFFLEFRWSDY